MVNEVDMHHLVNAVRSIWIRYPSLRYGQLVSNLYKWYFKDRNIDSNSDIYYVEDEDFYKWLTTEFKGFE